MPTYLTGNPPDFPELPMLEFFSGLKQDGCTSGVRLIGQFRTIADVDKIVPRPGYRAELEYCEGEEEIRLVDEKTGDYYGATGEDARAILKKIKARQDVDLKEDGNYPGGHRRNDLTEKVFIFYTKGGGRIWPPLRRAGICETVEEFLGHDNGDVVWDQRDKEYDTCEDYYMICNVLTGDYWVTTPKVAGQLREKYRKEREERAKAGDDDLEFDEAS
jgi:hypothetical protein